MSNEIIKENKLCEEHEINEPEVQYILNEDGKMITIPKDAAVPVEHPIVFKVINAYEVFVQRKNTDSYWISNYGRIVSNHRYTNKKKFYEHKGATACKVHEINSKKKKGNNVDIEYIAKNIKISTMVAEAFLKKYRNRPKIWHKDGDESNNWYKNLIYVSTKDFKRLKSGEITWDKLKLKQEYIEYENKSVGYVMRKYHNIRNRCGDTKDNEHVGRCYDDAYMCKEWWNNPMSFVEWYLQNYYYCDGESLAVDKDLFGNDSKEYSPLTCCLLPQKLNTFLSNCKKNYHEGETPENTLPYGVKYDSKLNKYYSDITYASKENGERRRLSNWDTPEEAFAEYMRMKEADLRFMLDFYIDKIPEHIYKKLLTIEIKPY